MTAHNRNGRPPGRGAAAAGLKVLGDWADFGKLKAPWDELAASCDAPFFVSHAWLSAWSAVYGSTMAPRIAQVWRDGHIVAAAPLGLTRRRIRWLPGSGSVRCLSALTNNETPMSEWLAAPGHEDALEKILSWAADSSGEWDMCELEPMVEDGRAALLREGASSMRLPSTWCATARSAIADTTKSWDDYLSARPRGFRRSIRKERRALEGIDHRLWLASESGGEVLERAFAVSVRSWKGSMGTAVGSTREQQELYRRLWSALGPEGEMDVSVLEIEGADAGSLIWLRGGDVVYAMKVDFVEQFKRYSPGRTLVTDLVRRTIAEGRREVDLLRLSRFTADFSDADYSLGRLRLFPRWNAPALWYSLEERLRPIGRGWRRRKRRESRSRGAHLYGDARRSGRKAG